MLSHLKDYLDRSNEPAIYFLRFIFLEPTILKLTEKTFTSFSGEDCRLSSSDLVAGLTMVMILFFF